MNASDAHETFGSRHGEGMNVERRPVGAAFMFGRSHLLELFHSELQSDLVCTVDDANSRRAYEQLMNLEID